MEKRTGIFLSSNGDPTAITSDDDSSDDSSLGDSSSSDDGDWGTGSNLDSAPDHVEQPLTGEGDGVVDVEQRALCLEPGWFVVFPLKLSSPCSLLVGKIVSMDSGRGEVTVEWYTPAHNRRCRRSMYGKGIWSQQFVLEGWTDGVAFRASTINRTVACH